MQLLLASRRRRERRTERVNPSERVVRVPNPHRAQRLGASRACIRRGRMTRTSGLDPLVVRDQVFQLIEGWHFVVGGRVHGVFTDRASAESEMVQQQQAEYDLKRRRG